MALWAARDMQRYRCPKFKSRLEDLSDPPPISLPLHFMSAMICPIIINVKMAKINLNNNNVLKLMKKIKILHKLKIIISKNTLQ